MIINLIGLKWIEKTQPESYKILRQICVVKRNNLKIFLFIYKKVFFLLAKKNCVECCHFCALNFFQKVWLEHEASN